jgi:hypothetical protein
MDGGGNGEAFPAKRDKTHLSDERAFGKDIRIQVPRKDFDDGGQIWDWDRDK